MQKYWEMKIIATILSTFYFGVILGVAISIYAHRNISELIQIKVYLQELRMKFSSQLKQAIAAHQQQKDSNNM